MSDLMLNAVIRMPFDMAMEGFVSQRQYYDRANSLLDDYAALQAACERLSEALQNANQSSGAEAYEIACEELASYQRERVKLGKNTGTQFSLVDGMASIFSMLDNAESERDLLRAELATVKKVAYGNLDLLSERDALRAELAAIKAQEPVAGRCRFTGLAYWAHCSVEHVTMALNAPYEWPHYEVQYLYALPVAPQPCTCPTGDGSLSWPCPRHSSQ